MQTFKQHLSEEQELLTEADTSKATAMEQAICVGYNMLYVDEIKEMEDGKPKLEAAATKAGVLNDWDKWIKLLETGKTIAGNRKESWGDYLTHSGADSSDKNHSSWPGADSTSKSDIRGNGSHLISLKNTGAPIMTAKGKEKGGEASAVFEFALKHYKKGASSNPKYVKALEILSVEMGKSARNKQVIRAGAGKAEFADWYVTKSDRVNELKKTNLGRDLQNYLKAELSMLGIPKKASNPQKKLISKYPDITPITKVEVGEYTKIFANTNDGAWSVGDSSGRSREKIMVGADHLANIDNDPEKAVKELGGDPLMKKQIADVVRTSMDAQDWKTALDAAFAVDSDLRSWIMYEAGSGYGKFTGKGKNNVWSKYSPGPRAVANYMVVWNTDGTIKTETDMNIYAQNNGDKVKNLDISYKSSSRSSYIKFGISSSYEHELPMLQEELDRLGAHYMLNEGIFRDLYTSARDKLKMLASKIKEALKNFWENVIMRFINELKDLLNEGIDKFTEALGITGTVTIENA